MVLHKLESKYTVPNIRNKIKLLNPVIPVLYSKSALLMVPVNLSCLLDRVPRIWLSFGKVPELIYITLDITVYSNEHPP